MVSDSKHKLHSVKQNLTFSECYFPVDTITEPLISYFTFQLGHLHLGDEVYGKAC